MKSALTLSVLKTHILDLMDGSELMSCLEVAGLHRSIKGYLKQVCEVVTVVVGMSSAT